jgi:anti-sigma factor RsiW
MKQRDLELLSSYLDGQLSPSDATRLEARLLVEPDLRSVLRDLRSARSMLRQLPMRKAPRNFRLTPKMVGKNPPLPRAYPAFRFTSALATIMLFITMGLNFIRPQLATAQPAFGMGGGGAPDTFSAESAPAAEMPAATEAPEEPSVAMVPQATMTIAGQEDTARALETPTNKEGETENAVGGGLDQPPAPGQALGVETAPVVPPVWQWLLAGVALLSAFIMAMMRQLSINRWRKKS